MFDPCRFFDVPSLGDKQFWPQQDEVICVLWLVRYDRKLNVEGFAASVVGMEASGVVQESGLRQPSLCSSSPPRSRQDDALHFTAHFALSMFLVARCFFQRALKAKSTKS